MVDPPPIALVTVGLVLLVGGAWLLVGDASGLAGSFGISPLVIELTVVAFGTSAPELAIAIGSLLAGEPDLVVGNVVGSNIYNVLLTLGLSALIASLVVETRLVRRDVPLDRSPRRGQQIATLLVGLGLLVVCAQGLVTGAVEIATLLGLPALVVGLTIVAIGTSLPELATPSRQAPGGSATSRSATSSARASSTSGRSSASRP